MVILLLFFEMNGVAPAVEAAGSFNSSVDDMIKRAYCIYA